jgi:hypothetical protein
MVSPRRVSSEESIAHAIDFCCWLVWSKKGSAFQAHWPWRQSFQVGCCLPTNSSGVVGAGGGRFRKLAAAAAAKSVMNSSPKVLCFCPHLPPLLENFVIFEGVGAAAGACAGGGRWRQAARRPAIDGRGTFRNLQPLPPSQSDLLSFFQALIFAFATASSSSGSIHSGSRHLSRP